MHPDLSSFHVFFPVGKSDRLYRTLLSAVAYQLQSTLTIL